jgi:tetratricopeptide (TPR) repeat protein
LAEAQVGSGFVGRERELRDLAGLLDEARAGRGRLALLGGEPGIGKTRLANELANRARAAGVAVYWGRGWEDAGAPPYWPWVQVLRGYLRAHDPPDISRHVGMGARDVVQILPELRQALPDLEPPPEAVSDSARFQLFDSTATLLRNAARDQPALIVLDDLQAADTPSLLLLQFLALQIGEMAALVFGTYRDIVLTPDHPLTAAISEIARAQATRLLKIQGLSPDAIGELIARSSATRSADSRAHPSVDRLAHAVWQTTAGNPLFVGEAVRLLSAEGRLTDVGDLTGLRIAVPASVRAVIERRLGRLEAPLVDVLRVGAVVGPEFSLDVLRRVLAIAGRAKVQIEPSVEKAVAAGLLVATAGTPGRYRFSHDLVRETLYDDLAPIERAELHRRIAMALESMSRTRRRAGLAELAFHAVQAVRLAAGAQGASDPLAERAVEYARRAGDEAARSLAYEEAARLYGMALDVLDGAGVPDADAVRAETLLGLGDVLARVRSINEARTAFLDAAELAKRMGDGQRLAMAALGVGGRLPWARPGNDTRLIPLLLDALALLGVENERLRVLVLSRLACALRSSPDRREESDALSREAIEVARRIDDLATLSYALSGRFWATWWPENPEERQALASEIVDVAHRLGDGERIIDAHLIRFLSLGELGRLAEARVELNALVRAIDELRQPAQAWLEPINRAYLALAVGDFDVAEAMIARQLRAEQFYTPGRDDLSAARMERFVLRREQGRVGEEEASIRASVDDFPWYPFYRAALACLLLEVGRAPEARAVFEDLARDAFSALYRDNEWLFGMSLASDACAALGDAEAAAVLYAQLAPFAGRHAIAHAEGSVGAVDRYLGLLALTRGDVPGAIHHLEAAVRVNQAMGALPWLAHSQHELATLLRERGAGGDEVRARSLDEAASRQARDLGMALADAIAPRAGEVPSTADIPATTTARFQRDGEYWSVEFGATPSGCGTRRACDTSPGCCRHRVARCTPSIWRAPKSRAPGNDRGATTASSPPSPSAMPARSWMPRRSRPTAPGSGTSRRSSRRRAIGTIRSASGASRLRPRLSPTSSRLPSASAGGIARPRQPRNGRA